ncbi:MAG: putative endonuclease [Saprospiraceae bacterium]|jgi:putative endonuclease
MSKNIELGNQGESIAKDYLINKGYQILETNWRFSRAEVDLIAMDGQILVFVEVKTRSTAFFGEPELAVNQHKQNLLIDAGNAYMEQINHEWEVRFDIISIILQGGKHSLEHFEDAFFSDWE